MLASFLSRVGFSYTSYTRFFFLSGEFLLHIPCLLFVWGVSLTHPMLAFFLSFFNVGRKSSLHIPCWLYFYLGSFSYTSLADFIFYCEEFLLHIPYCLCFYLGSFSYTSHACIIFLWGVSLTHPMLASFHSFFFGFFYFFFQSGEFL